MNETTEDTLQGVVGVAKFALSRIPVVGDILAGYDAYQASKFKRMVLKFYADLNKKVSNIENLFSDEWLSSNDGSVFLHKVIDCILDSQIEEKQDFFTNALINGIKNKELSVLDKYNFIDTLRKLSKQSLMILAEMHHMFKDTVRIPGKSITGEPFPLIDRNTITQKLSDRFHPYIVSAAIYELESLGLFSNIGEWKKQKEGGYISGGGFANELAYTYYTYSFVEFISINKS